MAPDAVIGLVERAGEVGAGVRQRKAVAAAPVVLGQPQHRDPVAYDGSTGTRCCMSRRCGTRTARRGGACVALGRQGRPGGVALRHIKRRRIAGLVLEPICDMLGIASLPGWDWFAIRRFDEPIELVGEPGGVDPMRPPLSRL